MYSCMSFHALASSTHLLFTGRTMFAHEPDAVREVLYACYVCPVLF